jgi:hypothetical protein
MSSSFSSTRTTRTIPSLALFERCDFIRWSPVRTNLARPLSAFRDLLNFFADIFELRAWRDKDPIACFMLAAFLAAIAQPVVYGSLGTGIVALMTPVK